MRDIYASFFAELEKLSSLAGQGVLAASRLPSGDRMARTVMGAGRRRAVLDALKRYAPSAKRDATINSRLSSISRGGRARKAFFGIADDVGAFNSDPKHVTDSLAKHRLVRAADAHAEGKLKISRGQRGGKVTAKFHKASPFEGTPESLRAELGPAAKGAAERKAPGVLSTMVSQAKNNPGKSALLLGTIGGGAYLRGKLKDRQNKEK